MTSSPSNAGVEVLLKSNKASVTTLRFSQVSAHTSVRWSGVSSPRFLGPKSPGYEDIRSAAVPTQPRAVAAELAAHCRVAGTPGHCCSLCSTWPAAARSASTLRKRFLTLEGTPARHQHSYSLPSLPSATTWSCSYPGRSRGAEPNHQQSRGWEV